MVRPGLLHRMAPILLALLLMGIFLPGSVSLAAEKNNAIPPRILYDEEEYLALTGEENERVLVDGILHDYYGATTVYIDREEQEMVLIFTSREDAGEAVSQINKKYGPIAAFDRIMKVPDAYGFSAEGAQAKPVSWGASYMGLDKLVSGNSRALGKRKVTVAIVDTGYNKSSFLLKGKKISSWSRAFYGKKTNLKDYYGHGSHVAGIIAGCTPDNVELMILKVTNNRGEAPISCLKAAFRYAIRHGADVINLSMGIENDKAWKIKGLNRTIDKAWRKGIPVVVAAGNGNESVRHCYPACYAKAITVSALNTSHKLAWYSNYGSTVDFAAPGTEILSSAETGTRALVYQSGTSMAAPHVTAAAAIIKAMQPSLSVCGVERELRSFSKDLGAKGKDKKYGYGVPKVGKLYSEGIRNSRYKIVGNLGVQKIRTLKNQGKGIVLTWKKVSGAEGYIIYRKKDSASWKKMRYVKGAASTSWKDKKVKAGHLYRYKVATYKLGYTGKTKIRSAFRLRKPRASLKSAGSGRLKVAWKKTGKVSGWQVKYAANPSFRKAKTVRVPADKRTVTLNKLKKGKTYYIKVRSYRKKGKIRTWSEWSAPKQCQVR